MVVREEEDENYYADNTLKAIGLGDAEGKGSVANNEINTYVQRSEVKHSGFRNVLLILWGCAFELWLYVIAVQLFYPRSANWPFATWLPLRLDYVGETAFISSFFFVTAVIMWNAKRIVRPRPQEPSPSPNIPTRT